MDKLEAVKRFCRNSIEAQEDIDGKYVQGSIYALRSVLWLIQDLESIDSEVKNEHSTTENS